MNEIVTPLPGLGASQNGNAYFTVTFCKRGNLANTAIQKHNINRGDQAIGHLFLLCHIIFRISYTSIQNTKGQTPIPTNGFLFRLLNRLHKHIDKDVLIDYNVYIETSHQRKGERGLIENTDFKHFRYTFIPAD